MCTRVYPDESGAYTLIEDAHHNVRAAPITHSAPCYGYSVTEFGKTHLDPAAIIALGDRMDESIKELKNGRPITTPSGRVIRPEDVTVQGVLPQRIVVLGDNCDASLMVPLAEGADVVVHEATLAVGEERLAWRRGHSTARMAGDFARTCGAKSLVLTHFGNAICTYDEEGLVSYLGRKDAEIAVASALGPLSGEMQLPLTHEDLGHWGGILETQRHQGLTMSVQLGPTTTVRENYEFWLRHRHLRTEPVTVLRHNFPPCQSSTSRDSMACERGAQEAFGRKQVLLARDYLAINLPRSSEAQEGRATARSTHTNAGNQRNRTA